MGGAAGRAGGKSVHLSLWLQQRGPLLADWTARYKLHPIHNDLAQTERDLLSRDLLADPTSRVYAAMTGGMALDVWAAVQTAAAVHALLGAPFEPPGLDVSAGAVEPVTSAELELARERLDRVSAIARLPE